MDRPLLNKEALVDYVKGSLREPNGATVPTGVYYVSGLEPTSGVIPSEVDTTEEDENGKPVTKTETRDMTRNWVKVHLEGESFSGVVTHSRFATAGWSDVPIKGVNKGRYYYPTKPIGSCFTGDIADFLVAMQHKWIAITAVNGKKPAFRLSSWATEAEAKKAAKQWSPSQYLRVTKIHDSKPTK